MNVRASAVKADPQLPSPGGPVHDKVVVVTGAISGLGLESAKQLARHGADVVIVVGDRTRGERARPTSRPENPPGC